MSRTQLRATRKTRAESIRPRVAPSRENETPVNIALIALVVLGAVVIPEARHHRQQLHQQQQHQTRGHPGIVFFVPTTITGDSQISKATDSGEQRETEVQSRGPASRAETAGTSGGSVHGCSRPPALPESRSEESEDSSQMMKDKYCFDYERFTHDYYEYEEGQKHIIVRGRLRENIQFWRDIGTNEFILDTLENGYKIPFYSMPQKSSCKNNKSALLEPDFVEEAITDLLDRNLIEVCTVQPFIVNPLTVAHNKEKKRLILDLRNVNVHIWKQSVKFDDIKTALSLLRKGHFMIKFDLTSAYHFIEIYGPHTDFLGFAWTNKNGVKMYYKFLVLPFGLSSACYIFTKVTRPLISKWRSEGQAVLMYLDDGFGCDKTITSTTELGIKIKNDLLLSGFIPNAKKSIWQPVQVIEFLGNVLDSILGIIFIPNRRIDKVFSTINDIFESIKVHRRVTARRVASIVGQLISMSIVTGHISQIMTRALSIDILQAKYWDSYIVLSNESINQLKFWEANLKLINRKDIFESTKCSKIVFSDASSTGYGGYEVNTVNGICHGMWNENEMAKSSTWRELVAVFKVLQSISHVLANQKVRWFSDNQGVSSIVKKGSMNKELQNIAFEIFSLCLKNSISLEMEWVPRTLNEKADYLSRIVDYDDWGLSDNLVSLIQDYFRITLEVDWFASPHNAKLDMFYSRFWNEKCQGIDAFSETWSTKVGLFVPPICMIYNVIRKLEHDKGFGVIVIPLWKSAIYWLLVCPNGNFIPEVINWFDLPTSKENYVRCKTGSGVFGNANLHFRMLALNVDFRVRDRQFSADIN